MIAEARVIGYQDGKGKHSGRMGALICEMLDSTGAEFKVGTGFSAMNVSGASARLSEV